MIRLCSILALCLGLIGCVPEQRFAWSPDGERALVIGQDRSLLLDTDGNTLAELPGLQSVCWLPDNSGIVAHRVRQTSEWNEFAAWIGTQRTEKIETLAREIPALVKAGRLLHGENLSPQEAIIKLSPERTSELKAALALSHGNATQPYQVHDLTLLRLGPNPIKSQLIHRDLREISSLRLSPDSQSIAFGVKKSESPRVDLRIASLNNDFPFFHVGTFDNAFDWSRDGKSIIAFSPVIGETGLLKNLTETPVFENGSPLPREDRKGSPLFTGLLPFTPSLTVLPDGHILLAAESGTLPASQPDLQLDSRFHLINPNQHTIKTIPTRPGDLPMNLGHYAVSPDGTHIAVVESATDAVAVVEVKSGRVEMLSPAHPGWQCRALPAWKSANELTFAALDPKTENIRWMIWDATTGNLSPFADEAIASFYSDWLEKKNPNTSTTLHEDFR